MWTPATRRQHSRDGLRYETDLTDLEWDLIEPLMPKPNRRGRLRWSWSAGQIGGLGKVDRGMGYAASFSIVVPIV